jgi:CheY-like chemotaxis protein
VLLVDDSEAVLAFETATLAGHFSLQTAADGREALAKLAIEAPDLVVLDLSMPRMNGEEVLAHLTADPRLSGLAVLIVSSEGERARACLARGARAFLLKPIRADDLLATVSRIIEQDLEAKRPASLACLPVKVGAMEMAIPLDAVDTVIPQVATTPLAFGPPYLREVFDLHGHAVFSLDLAARLGVEHAAPLVERKLVVLRQQALRLALCVDDVRDPEEVEMENVAPRDRVGGASHGELRETLVAVIRTTRGSIPLVDPRAFATPALLDALAAWLAARHKAPDDVLEASWE